MNNLPMILVECRLYPNARVETMIGCRESQLTAHLHDSQIISSQGDHRSLTDMHVACMRVGQVGTHGNITSPRERMRDIEWKKVDIPN